MTNEKEFNEYNFFEQIDRFIQYTKKLKNISTDLIDEAIEFFNLVKEANLKLYSKIDPDKSSIFINEKDFGLEIFLLNYPEKRILFHFDKNETPLLFYENGKIQDCLFGQGATDSCDYLLKYLKSI